MLQLGVHRIPSQQSLSNTQRIPYLWPHEEAPGWQTICNRCQHEYVAPWLQTCNTDFFYTRIKALMPKWDKCLNVWWPCKGPMYTICNSHITYTSKVRMASLASDSLLTYCSILISRSFILRDPRCPAVLTSGCWWPNEQPAPQHRTPCPMSWQQYDPWTCWWIVPTCLLAPHSHTVVVRPVITKTQPLHSINTAERLHFTCTVSQVQITRIMTLLTKIWEASKLPNTVLFVMYSLEVHGSNVGWRTSYPNRYY